jgi:hypothetical protein
MKVALKRTAIATATAACVALLSFSWSEQRGVSLGVESVQARVDSPGGLHPETDCSRPQSPQLPRLGTTMTTIAMVTLTQAGATLLAIITAAILAATASVAATPPELTHGRRYFRATTAAGAGEAVLAAVDSLIRF